MSSAMPSPSVLLRDIATCVSFYTRLPVPAHDARGLADAHWAAPVAGAVVGLLTGLVLALTLALGVPAGIAAAIVLAAGAALTGALHEDGLADVADGFGGGRTRDDKLAIMKDSRLGTYGAVALMLALLARWSALVVLAATGATMIVLVLVAAHAASRSTIPLFMHRLPSARAGGLSAGVGDTSKNVALAAAAVGAVFLLPLGFGFVLVGLALLVMLFLLLERLALRQIGGQTGDVLGALQQGGEILLLTLAATLLI